MFDQKVLPVAGSVGVNPNKAVTLHFLSVTSPLSNHSVTSTDDDMRSKSLLLLTVPLAMVHTVGGVRLRHG